MNADLQLFVRESLTRGIPRAAIAETLTAAGWRREEIAASLAAYAETDFPVPVPRRRPYVSAREAFLHLVLFATLYTTAYNVGVVLFSLLEHWMPDASQPWGANVRGRMEAVRGATAALIIAFPVFLLLSRAIGRALAAEPEERSSKVRKWLTYVTLFTAAMVIIGDLIVLVSRLLGGELPLRVLLKVAVVLAIAGTVFGHYLGELRRDEREGATPIRNLRVPPRVAALAVAVVVFAGLLFGGSPARERRRQLDSRRLEDLHRISLGIDTYVGVHGRLPATLDPVATYSGVSLERLQDPVSKERYFYAVLDSVQYELCARFDGAESDTTGAWSFWHHSTGRHCYRFSSARDPRSRRFVPTPPPGEGR